MSTHSNQEDLRQELLEYAFDCHPNPEAIAARIAGEPDVARLFTEVQGTAALLNDAASAEAPPLDLEPPRADRGADAARSPSAPPRPWSMRHAWVAAAAMIGITILVGLVHYAVRSGDLKRVQNGKVRVLLSAPAAVPDGTPLRFHVETHNLAQQPMAAQVAWQVLNGKGEVIASESGTCSGSADYTAAGRLQQPRTLVVTARVPATGFEETVRQTIQPTHAAPLVHVTSDKPVYRPGEQVHLRFACLDRLTLRGIDRQGLRVRLLDPQDNQQAEKVLRVGSGVATWSYPIPPSAAGGDYSVQVRVGKSAVSLETFSFLVRHFQPRKLRQKILLDRQSYAPGETGVATVTVNRAGTGPAAGASVDASLIVDGETTWTRTGSLDGTGTASFQFEVPAVVAKGAARFVTRVNHGGVVETGIEPFVIPTGKVEVDIYPEGGQLVAGTRNRVYVQVRDPLGRPLAGLGEIVDDQGRVCAPFETEHMGRGRVEFAPATGRRYRLRLTIPNTATFALPEVRTEGVVLCASRDTFPGSADPAFDVFTSGAGPWLATVFCRGVLVGQRSILTRGPSRVTVPLVDAASGVLRFTVFDREMQPVAERLFQREASRELRVALDIEKSRLQPGGGQKIRVRTTDENGDPVAAVVGITVADRAVGDMVDFVRTGLVDQQQLWTDAKRPDEKAEEFLAPAARRHRNVDLLLGCMGWRLFAWTGEAETSPMVAAAGDWAEAQPVREGRAWSPRVTDTLGAHQAELRRAETRADDAWGLFVRLAWFCLLGGLLLATAQGVFQMWRRLPAGFRPISLAAVGGCAGLLVWALMEHGLELVEDAAPGAAPTILTSSLDGASFDGETLLYFEDEPPISAVDGYAAWYRDVPGFMNPRPIILDSLNAATPTFSYRTPDTALSLVDTHQLLTHASRLYPNLFSYSSTLVSGRVADVTGDTLTLNLLGNTTGLTAGTRLKVFHVQNGAPQSTGVATLVSTEDGRYLATLPGAARLGVAANDWVATDPLANLPNLGPGQRRVLGRVFANPVLAGIALRHKHQKGTNRRDFTETILWQPFLLTDERGEAEVEFDTSSSITTWNVSVDAHGDGRVGQAHEEFTTYLPFSLDAKIPEHAQEGDVLRIPITVVAEDRQAPQADVEVQVRSPLELLGAARQTARLKDGRGRVWAQVRVGDGIAAGALGEITIAGSLASAHDRLTRRFAIAPRGFPREKNLSGEIKDKEILKFDLPDELARRTATLSLRFYPSPIATLEGALAGMLREPHGCFEQVSSSNYPNVMILSLAGSPAGDGTDPLRERALRLLRSGYQKLSGYEVEGGGFDWWGKKPAHAGLTAYGLLQFTDMAGVFDGVDPAMVARTRAWLLGTRDGKGGFRVGGGRYAHFMGGSPAARNAYVCYALLYAGEPAGQLAPEINRLAERVLTTDDAYELAVAACALAEARHPAAATGRRRLLQRAEPDGSLLGAGSIVGSGPRDLRVETTAFAVLAWLAGGDQKKERGVAVQKALGFLLSQRKGAGHFGGTQATVMALKALSTYMTSSHQAVQPGQLTVRVNGEEFRRPLFGAEKQTIDLVDLHRGLKVGGNQIEMTLTGDNAFPYAMELSFRTDEPASSKRCAVQLETMLSKTEIQEGETTAVRVKLRNTLDQPVSNPMVWVGLPAGLHVDSRILDDLKKAETIAHWELRDHGVVLYLRGLHAGQAQDIAIDCVGRIPGVTRGASSRAYLYYAAGEKHWTQPMRITIHAP